MNNAERITLHLLHTYRIKAVLEKYLLASKVRLMSLKDLVNVTGWLVDHHDDEHISFQVFYQVFYSDQTANEVANLVIPQEAFNKVF